MNNSRLAQNSISLQIEQNPDTTVRLREREERNIRIIEAIQEVQRTKGWSSLKNELFEPLVGTLGKALEEEAKKETPDSGKLNRIAGQLKWAEKFSDLAKLAEPFKVELTSIKKQLHGKNES